MVGALAFGVAWLVLVSLDHDHRHASTARFHWRDVLSAYRPLIGHGPTLRLLVVATLRAMGWFTFLIYNAALLSDQFGFSTRQIGGTFFLGGGAFVLGGLLAGAVLKRWEPRRVLTRSCVGMALTLAFTFSASLGAPMTVALFPLLGLMGALGWVALVSLLGAESPAGRGTTMSLNGALTSLGSALGGLIGGILLASGGYSALAIGLPLVLLVAAFLAGRDAARAPMSALG